MLKFFKNLVSEIRQVEYLKGKDLRTYSIFVIVSIVVMALGVYLIDTVLVLIRNIALQ